MRVPTEREPKNQKQSDDENLTFTDREVEAFLCHLSEEKLVDVVKENNRTLLIANRISSEKDLILDFSSYQKKLIQNKLTAHGPSSFLNSSAMKSNG